MDLCNTVVENLAKNTTLMWKAEFLKDELGYLAEEISKQDIESLACFLLVYSKM